MPEYTPSAWIKPNAMFAGDGQFQAWYDFKVSKTSRSYKEIYLAATMVPPDERSMQIAEDFSMHIAKLRLKRQL